MRKSLLIIVMFVFLLTGCSSSKTDGVYLLEDINGFELMLDLRGNFASLHYHEYPEPIHLFKAEIYDENKYVLTSHPPEDMLFYLEFVKGSPVLYRDDFKVVAELKE